MPSDIHSRDSRLYTVHDLLEWTPPKYTRIIGSGILNIGNRMMIFGDEGSWKSILALHTAHCVANGSNWLGFRTYPSNVLRLQAELPMYTDRARVEKYCEASKRIYVSKDGHESITSAQLDELDLIATAYAYPSNAISRSEEFIHIDESSGWESLKKNIESCIIYLPKAPLLVIIDPMYKVFNRNMSDEQDMKVLLDKIDILMGEIPQRVPGIGISFILIHHTRKAKVDDKGNPVDMGSQDANASRVLAKWCDTVLRIDPYPNDSTKSRVNLRFTKHRNAEDVLPEMKVRWDRDTLHPHILSRVKPIYEDDEELRETGDEFNLSQLE